jgi:hypothetical protein
MACLLPSYQEAFAQPEGPSRWADIQFERAVELSIMAEPGTQPPEPYRGLLEGLGSSWHALREDCHRELDRLSAARPQWLWWGLASHDAEVRQRCAALLRARYGIVLVICYSCRGGGSLRLESGERECCFVCLGPGYWWDCLGAIVNGGS